MSKLRRYLLDPTIRRDRSDMMGWRVSLPSIDMDIYYEDTDDIPTYIKSTEILERWCERKGYGLTLCKSKIGNYYVIITEDFFHRSSTINRYNINVVKDLI